MQYSKSVSSYGNLYERIQKLLVSYEWSDCSFYVGGKTFKAHKLILGISSPVFEAMFYGPLANNKEVNIIDIEPDIFQLLLNYVYTDQVCIDSTEQAFELLYAARKYMLEGLTAVCIKYIQENINFDNVIEVLNDQDFLQDTNLITYLLDFFCKYADFLLKHYKNNLTPLTLKSILVCNDMNIKEKDLILNVFEWTECYCEQNKIPNTLENRRRILLEFGIFKLLRFLTLSQDEICDILRSKNNLLLPEETKKLERQEKTTLQDLSQLPRTKIPLLAFFCYRSPIRSVAPLVIDINNNQVQCRFKASKSLFINAICIPTRMVLDVCIHNVLYMEHFYLNIYCESDNSLLISANCRYLVKYDTVMDINLEEPCFIKKDVWYKVNFMWPEDRLSLSYHYFVQCRDKTFNSPKVLFEFDDLCNITGTDGSFLAGLKYCF